MYKTNRFHLAVRVFSDKAQRTSKRGKNISHTSTPAAQWRTCLFLPGFDVICLFGFALICFEFKLRVLLCQSCVVAVLIDTYCGLVAKVSIFNGFPVKHADDCNFSFQNELAENIIYNQSVVRRSCQ